MKLDFTLPKFLNGWIKSARAVRKPIKRTHRKRGRNELCRCGSMMRYKHCCWQKDKNQLADYVKRGL